MGFWQDSQTGTWKFSFKYQKQRYGGGGYKTRKMAVTAREEKRKAVKRDFEKGILKSSGPMTFLGAVSSYIEFSERRHAVKTFRYKQLVYKLFGEHLKGDLPLQEISPAMISSYLSTCRTNPVYNAHRKDLMALFSYAMKVLEVPLVKNPCSVIEKLPQDKRAKKTWTTEEFKALLRCLTKEEGHLILTVAYTMARIDEILRLTVADINFTQKYLTLYTRKNKDGAYRGRNIPMSAPLIPILSTICNGRAAGEYVFMNPKTGTRYTRRPKMMRGLCNRAGITHYGFHAIRHFITSYLYNEKDAGKTDLQKLLGHQTPTTTDIYINSLDGNLRAPVEKLTGLLNEKPVAPSSGTFTNFKANSGLFSLN